MFEEQTLNLKGQIDALQTLNQSLLVDRDYWHSETLDSHRLYEEERERNTALKNRPILKKQSTEWGF